MKRGLSSKNFCAIADCRDTLQQKRDQVQEANTQLATVLSESVEKGFTLLFDEARRQVQQGEQSSGRRIEITRQLQGLKIQLEPFEQSNTRTATAVADATTKWAAQCQNVGMPETVSPKSGLVLLQERKELLAKFDSWKEASAESQNTKEAVRQFEQDVREKAVLFGASGDTTEAQEVNLWKMLAKARDAQTRHEQLAEQIEEAQDTLDESRHPIHRRKMGWMSWYTWQSLKRLNCWNRCLQV